MPLSRRHLIAAALLAATATPAFAEATYPDRPVRIVVGASAGGVTDVVARFFGEYFARQAGAQIVVENVTGAGGNVAFAQVAKAEPDGYTLGLAAAGNIVINPTLYKNMRFDPIADLVAVAPIAAAPQVIVVQKDVPAQNLGELLSLAKGKPGTLNYGSAGVGTTNHIAGALLARQAGIELVHVPYRGIAPAVTDLVGGRIQLMSVAVSPVIGFVQDGSVRPLAVATKERLRDLPEVPTAAEAGLQGYEMTTWFGLVGPKGMPQPIIERLNAAVRAMVADPTERKRLESNFLVPISQSPEEFARFVKQDAALWSKTITDLGIQLN